MKERQTENNDAIKKIKMKFVFADGCDRFTFIQINSKNKYLILYALTDKGAESHAELFETAIEEGLIDGEIEPSGGGIYNPKTGYYERPSFQYGEADEQVLRIVERKLQDIVPCNERYLDW